METQSTPEDNIDVQYNVDTETGFADPESVLIDDVAANNEVIRTANYLQEMQDTVGWNILMGFVGEEINSLLVQLRKEDGINKIRRLQCLIESLELLPKIVDKLKDSAAKAQEVLNLYTTSNNQ